MVGEVMIGVVDYRAGNLKSVETALRYLGADFFVSQDPKRLIDADRLLFPGVGEAAAAMGVLRETGLDETILAFFVSGKPLLGICIGCQIALESSEERDTACLGLVRGRVVRFTPDLGLKVPHMGWNQVTPVREHRIFEGIPTGSSFYFVHSYYPLPQRKDRILAKTEYGISFASSIWKDNLVAVQFHPEKSGEVGLRLLQNFIRWNP
jgi:glutamine amidotransferase